ncbi:MAG: hypothetical protein ABI378_13285 [Chitinophagaceae bacterium]
MNDKILGFLKSQTAASICCITENNEPYAFSCFYAFQEKDSLLHFKSGTSTYHSQILLKNPLVSGTIMPDKLNKLATKGIQFSGIALAETDSLCVDAFKTYHSKFPLALAIKGIMWTIKLAQLKMTDNIGGIFRKHTWQRGEQDVLGFDQNQH